MSFADISVDLLVYCRWNPCLKWGLSSSLAALILFKTPSITMGEMVDFLAMFFRFFELIFEFLTCYVDLIFLMVSLVYSTVSM